MGLAAFSVLGALEDFVHTYRGSPEAWKTQKKLFAAQSDEFINHQGFMQTLRRICSFLFYRQFVVRQTSDTLAATEGDLFTFVPMFRNLQFPEQATSLTPLHIFFCKKPAEVKMVLSDFAGKLNQFCLTKQQIISIVRDNQNWLRRKFCYGFFLLKVGVEYFVVVSFGDEGEVCLTPLSNFMNSEFGLSGWYYLFVPSR